MILALSIICTLGISLILWLPVWYVMGYVIMLIPRRLLEARGIDIRDRLAPKKGGPAGEEQPGLSRDQQALIDYIKKAQTKGLSNDQISQNLGKNGWTTASITAAFQLVGSGS
jgi:hypothetical protein